MREVVVSTLEEAIEVLELLLEAADHRDDRLGVRRPQRVFQLAPLGVQIDELRLERPRRVFDPGRWVAKTDD